MRSIRLAALAVAMTLAFSGLALARDHDDDDHPRDQHADRHHDWDHDRDHHGDRDWNRDRDRNRDRSRAREQERWEREHRGWGQRNDHDRDDGYYRGPVYNRYPNGYPGTYSYPGGGYGGTIYGRGNGRNLGYNFGYQDGVNRAREDMAKNKPFNPNPRGSEGNRDRGYNSSYGDKNYYRAEYTQGYQSGYRSAYRGGGSWGY